MASLQVPGISASEALQLQSQLKPSHFDLTRLIRPNILSLQPYRCARDDYQSGTLLDANENSLGPSLPPSGTSSSSGKANGSATVANGIHPADPTAAGDDDDHLSHLSLHRYPDPSLFGIRTRLTSLRSLPSESYVFLGVGSDEVLDLIQRVIGVPGKDKICICPPTYGMYSVCAAVNDLEVVKVPLKVEAEGEERFTLDVDKILSTVESDPSIKILFLCSPGNPTGTLIPLSQILTILNSPRYSGLIVVDEAYIDFTETAMTLGMCPASSGPVSAVSLVTSYANLIVTQTLSKAYGLAAIRLGVAYAAPPLIAVMNNTKAPYNISTPAAHIASRALSDAGLATMRENVASLIRNRETLAKQLWQQVPATGQPLGQPDANFLLVPVLDAARDVKGAKPDGARAAAVYKKMAEEHALVVRDRSKELGCAGCLRITVGTEEENRKCVELMKELLK